jgi:HTH-type transcriptional regulator, quorum sensing regulator NprR
VISLQFGPLIKYYRTQKGLTQKELANGICSVSHLSKIENNGKEANDETISLLLDRLHISINRAEEQEKIIGDLLKRLNEKIYFYQKYEVEDIISQLKDYDAIIPFTSYLHTYELYKMRYLLFLGNVNQADLQKEILKKLKKSFSQHEIYLFHYCSTILYILKGQFEQADQQFDSLFQISHDFSSGEFLYYRSMVKAALQQSGHAIHFAKAALQSYMNEHNFIRILHCLLLLGINYTHSGIFEEAKSCFHHLERNATLLNETNLLPQIYHNIGLLYKKLKDFDKAMLYLNKSLSLQLPPTTHFLVTQYVKGQVAFETHLHEVAKEAFTITFTLSDTLNNKKYSILSKYYLLALENHSKSIQYVILTVIPYLESSNENKDDLLMFYKLLSKHYHSTGMFEKAVYYLNKTI